MGEIVEKECKLKTLMKVGDIKIGHKYFCKSPQGNAAIYIVESIVLIPGDGKVRRSMKGKRIATQSTNRYIWKCRCLKGYIPNSTIGFKSIRKFLAEVN